MSVQMTWELVRIFLIPFPDVLAVILFIKDNGTPLNVLFNISYRNWLRLDGPALMILQWS